MNKALHYRVLDFLSSLRDPESFGGQIPLEARTIARELSRALLLSNIPGTSNDDFPTPGTDQGSNPGVVRGPA